MVRDGNCETYQDGPLELRSNLLQSTDVLPADVGHSGEAFSLGRGVHDGQCPVEVFHFDKEIGDFIVVHWFLGVQPLYH